MVFGLSVDEKALKVLMAAMEALGMEAEREDMMASAIYEGGDMDVAFHAAAYKGKIQMSAILAIEVPPEREVDMLRELNRRNLEEVFGAYRLHDNGMVTYDLTHFYKEEVPSQDVLEALIVLAIGTADEADGELEAFLEGD